MQLLKVKNNIMDDLGDFMCETAWWLEDASLTKMSNIFWCLGSWFYSKSDTPNKKFEI
jgi:hypothetical protein|tara:strand:- start:3798 stop:3971 length:174 start_codon:yes stop_codon:yes gene_type:complete